MRTIGMLAAVMLAGSVSAAAQDVAGIEDCTKTSGLDKRTGCMQSNVNFLQRTATRNALEAHRRLQAAESEIAVLRSTVADLRKGLDELAAARKAEDKKSEGTKK
jgi:hypothetical protein